MYLPIAIRSVIERNRIHDVAFAENVLTTSCLLDDLYTYTTTTSAWPQSDLHRTTTTPRSDTIVAIFIIENLFFRLVEVLFSYFFGSYQKSGCKLYELASLKKI